MYKHCEANDGQISLHDCRATKIGYDGKTLTFFFENGFWIAENHPENPTGNMVRTDQAEAVFQLDAAEDGSIDIYVFSKRWKKTVREEWKLSQLIDHVNKHGGALEFLYEYKGCHVQIVDCCLWSKRAPYSRECELRLPLKTAQYNWNSLREDCVW